MNKGWRETRVLISPCAPACILFSPALASGREKYIGDCIVSDARLCSRTRRAGHHTDVRIQAPRFGHEGRFRAGSMHVVHGKVKRRILKEGCTKGYHADAVQRCTESDERKPRGSVGKPTPKSRHLKIEANTETEHHPHWCCFQWGRKGVGSKGSLFSHETTSTTILLYTPPAWPDKPSGRDGLHETNKGTGGVSVTLNFLTCSFRVPPASQLV